MSPVIPLKPQLIIEMCQIIHGASGLGDNHPVDSHWVNKMTYNNGIHGIYILGPINFVPVISWIQFHKFVFTPIVAQNYRTFNFIIR